MKRPNFIRIATAFIMLLSIVSSANAAIQFDFNFSGASGGTLSDAVGVNQIVFTASSVLGFRDGGTGESARLRAGDTFTDYTVIRMTQFVDSGGYVTPLAYGSEPGRAHEVTATLVFKGLQQPVTTG